MFLEERIPMKLFDEYPYMENDHIVICKMTQADAQMLKKMTCNPNVYEFLPTFLYEQKYDDKSRVIDRMDEECFDTKESILLGIYLKADPEKLVGIAEIYNYEEEKAKASIGYRLDEPVWGQGIGTEVCALLKDYLLNETDIQTITAHIMTDNKASARSAQKNGFICKYPNTYGDWGFDELIHTDKYVFKRAWLDEDALERDEDGTSMIPEVNVEQFVMAYEVEQDRIRALLPEGFLSLRPVLRINTEIRNEKVVYIEFNTPVEAEGRRGWLNIANWKSTRDAISFARADKVTISAPFLTVTYKGTGIEGGCPAEKDNDGCYFLRFDPKNEGDLLDKEFRPVEPIDQNKEFCDCEFTWKFHEGDAHGVSQGKTLPAVGTQPEHEYPKTAFTAENAAAIPCRQVLGAYIVRFERYGANR